MKVAAFVAAVLAKDAAGVAAALAPGFRGNANGKPLDGEGQVRLLSSFWEGFPDAKWTIEATGGSGRHVIVWRFEGTHGGPYLGVPPTGQPFALGGYAVSVSDASGILELNWKWDTKAFGKAVLGEEIQVAPPRPDPRRNYGDGLRGGPRRGKAGKGRGRGPGRERGPPAQPAQPAAAAVEADPAAQPASAPSEAPPTPPAEAPAAPMAPSPEAPEGT